MIPIQLASDSTSVTESDGNTSSDLSMRDFHTDSEEDEEQRDTVAVLRGVEKTQTETEVRSFTDFTEVLTLMPSSARNNTNKLEEKGVTGENDSNFISIKDEDVGKYVAVYYTDPKAYYCWGQIRKVFSNDVESAVEKIEVDFLRKKPISSCPSEVNWTEKKPKETLIVDTEFILLGPVVPKITGSTMKFPDTNAVSALKKLVDGK